MNQQGMILVSIVGIMLFLGLIMIGVFSLAAGNLARAKGRVFQLESQYAAESGADAAIAILNSGNDTYVGSASEVEVLSSSHYRATYTINVASGSTAKERQLTAVGRVYSPKSATTAKYVRTIRVVAQRSSTSTASSILSRNILALDSGVKNVYAKDLSVNGYITMAKNTTNLVAENITVAGKNTGATNCSIGGSGNLVKPTSFSTPGQTKTNITVAYNNCITPPGNSSSTDFNVLANQNNISAVQSTYLPWAQYMDSSYTNATNGCNDWTTGGTTRNIPSTTTSKKTHYPDNASTVSSSCGTSGDINLGSNRYNIYDNVHIRANFCASSGCTPSFYNPTAAIKYVFIEGTANFDSIQTVAGSGPLAFVVYGTDPASNAGLCPYGGAAYLGNSGTTSAPALYLLASNGICLDKTKFGNSPALGGIGGKNIYIATNSGSPFDLTLDTSFPSNQIPIDLTWRAVRYLRL
ncbi:MAG: hypothetical protein ABIV43_04160 [Candidatus Saccharimonadales bacterium]